MVYVTEGPAARGDLESTISADIRAKLLSLKTQLPEQPQDMYDFATALAERFDSISNPFEIPLNAYAIMVELAKGVETKPIPTRLKGRTPESYHVLFDYLPVIVNATFPPELAMLTNMMDAEMRQVIRKSDF